VRKQTVELIRATKAHNEATATAAAAQAKAEREIEQAWRQHRETIDREVAAHAKAIAAEKGAAEADRKAAAQARQAAEADRKAAAELVAEQRRRLQAVERAVHGA
jgi:colicin import membrane protein